MQGDEPSDAEAIQRAWRKAVQQLAEAPPGSPESDRLAARVRDLAADYRAAMEARAKVKAKAPKHAGGDPPDPETTRWSHVEPRPTD